MVLEFTPVLVLVLGLCWLPTALSRHLLMENLLTFHPVLRHSSGSVLRIALEGYSCWIWLSLEIGRTTGIGHFHCSLNLPILTNSEVSQGVLTRCCCVDSSPGDEFLNLESEIHQLVLHRVVLLEAQTGTIPLPGLQVLQVLSSVG